MNADKKISSRVSKKLSTRHKACQLWCNRFIKALHATKSGYLRCCTCPKSGYYTEFEAGHFLSVGGHGSVRYEIENIHPQCNRCNSYLSGNLIEYYEFMKRKYGQDKIDDLRARSKQIKKFKWYELYEMELYFKDEYNRLSNEKNIPKYIG